MCALIVLVRHGEIDKPVPRRFLGQTDLPLNDRGVAQARCLGQVLADLCFERVFASPLQRAVQTAALICVSPSPVIETIDALREIDLGEWEGLTVAEVQQRFPGEYERRGEQLPYIRPSGGESFGDLAARCYPAFLELAALGSGPLLVVAHAGVNRVILARLSDRPLQDVLTIPQDYCAINLIRSDSPRLQIEALNLGLDADLPNRITIHAHKKNDHG